MVIVNRTYACCTSYKTSVGHNIVNAENVRLKSLAIEQDPQS